jgi:hypothetical protein
MSRHIQKLPEHCHFITTDSVTYIVQQSLVFSEPTVPIYRTLGRTETVKVCDVTVLLKRLSAKIRSHETGTHRYVLEQDDGTSFGTFLLVMGPDGYTFMPVHTLTIVVHTPT